MREVFSILSLVFIAGGFVFLMARKKKFAYISLGVAVVFLIISRVVLSAAPLELTLQERELTTDEYGEATLKGSVNKDAVVRINDEIVTLDGSNKFSYLVELDSDETIKFSVVAKSDDETVEDSFKVIPSKEFIRLLEENERIASENKQNIA